MSMRELAVQAMAMRNAGKSPVDIRKFVWRGMTALTMEDRTPMTEYDIAPDCWQIGRGTGEVITCGQMATGINPPLDENRAFLRYAPPEHMVQLTEQRSITPYSGIHPEEDR
jgi:hypothetical protein